MAWNDLSMKEKAAYMKVAVANGITNLDDISNAYNSFADGGPLSNNLAKPFSYEPIPAVRYGDGGKTYNIFKDPQSYDNRDKHKASLEAWVKNNPEVNGLKTADWVDFFSQIAGIEGSYNPLAGEGMTYSGYYGLKGGRNLNANQQHATAFKHLSDILKNNIVKEDLEKAKKQGYTPAQTLAKYWNQGNRVTNYLYNGVDATDGVGTKVSNYGWNMTAKVPSLDMVNPAITDDFVLVENARTLADAIKRARNTSIDYSNREKSILDINTGRNSRFNPNRLQVNDTIWLVPQQLPTRKRR